jgi:hypothetical protein
MPLTRPDRILRGMSTKTYTGGCHCGKVRFEADLDLSQGTGQCTCSICHKSGWWGTNTKPAQFRLLSGEDNLLDYQFNTKAGHQLFCKTCGIRSFGRGHVKEIGGDYVSINVRCLDDAEADLARAPVTLRDGRANTWAELGRVETRIVPPRPPA